MPELTFDSVDMIPEGLRDFAKETEDGKVNLNVVPKAKLDEFRENNIKLATERDKLAEAMEKYKSVVGDDLDEFLSSYEEMKTLKQRAEDGELVENKGLEEALKKRTEEMRADYEGKIESLLKDRDTWKEQASAAEAKYQNTLIERAITDAVVAEDSGARPDALPDIIARARQVWRVEKSGELKAYDGDNVLYGADGATPMSPSEWLNGLKKVAPYFFKDSSGGGAGSDATIGSGKLTPEQIATLSMDEYEKLRQSGKI